jgi:glycosyltransferase involved in cell wall biosynthesis
MNVLSIIVPLYNEVKTITALLNALLDVQLTGNPYKEIILVDDGSTDGTEEAVKPYISKSFPACSVLYYRHEHNKGKGAAIQTGLSVSNGNIILLQDADMEYNPSDINTLLQPIIYGYADVVYGSRFISKDPHRVLYYWHSVGNKFLTMVSNMFSNINLTDMETGYKIFRSEIIKAISLKEQAFGIEPEITAKIAKIRGIRIYEVGISYFGRTYAEGKKVNWRDGVRALYCILRYNLFD